MISMEAAKDDQTLKSAVIPRESGVDLNGHCRSVGVKWCKRHSNKRYKTARDDACHIVSTQHLPGETPGGLGLRGVYGWLRGYDVQREHSLGHWHCCLWPHKSLYRMGVLSSLHSCPSVKGLGFRLNYLSCSHLCISCAFVLTSTDLLKTLSYYIKYACILKSETMSY